MIFKSCNICPKCGYQLTKLLEHLKNTYEMIHLIELMCKCKKFWKENKDGTFH